jgi:hypothetical protein
MSGVKRIFFSIVPSVMITLFSSIIFADAPMIAQKTLDRWVDPVIMEGNLLKDATGKSVSNLRLYAYKNGSFIPIRYQIDETSEDGDWILDQGRITNTDLANGKFDPQDKLIFMADDSGDRVSKEVWPQGFASGDEIEIIDPLTGKKGWCYLLYFPGNPPARSSEPPCVTYNYETEVFLSDYIGAKYIITKDGLHSTYYEGQWYTFKAGGNNKSYVDRLKIRIRAKMLFGTLTVHFNEEGLKSDVIAYRIGPIRLIRRVEQYAKMPGGVKALRVVSDVIFYRTTTTVPVMYNVPFQLNTVLTSAVIRFGTDYNPTVIGSWSCNSNNPDGFIVDGKMGDAEKNFNPKVDAWRLITGDFGTYMTRTIFTPEILRDIKITMGVIDDISQEYPPEKYPGSIGYLWQDWDISALKRGKYYLFLDFCHPPHYKKGDEMKYVNYMDHPVRLKVGTSEGQNKPLLLPNLGAKYR